MHPQERGTCQDGDPGRRLGVSKNSVVRKYLDLQDAAIVTILTPEPSGKPVAGKPHGQGVESFSPAHVKRGKVSNMGRETLSRLEGEIAWLTSLADMVTPELFVYGTRDRVPPQ